VLTSFQTALYVSQMSPTSFVMTLVQVERLALGLFSHHPLIVLMLMLLTHVLIPLSVSGLLKYLTHMRVLQETPQLFNSDLILNVKV
jgi:hypothetical protein